VSARDAFCSNPNYTKASWVNIAHIVFHELTGINVIQLQSNVLLKKVTAGSSTFTPRLGSIIISAFNMFGAMASFPIVAKFGRKPILMWGYTFICIFHMTIGVLTILDKDYAVLVFICLFIMTYQVSTG
jgi:hypothetical protein